MTPEDVGEIKFTAEKASSSAKLKVKGKSSGIFNVALAALCQQQELKTSATNLEAGCKWIPQTKSKLISDFSIRLMDIFIITLDGIQWS